MVCLCLEELDFDVNEQDADGNTPLHVSQVLDNIVCKIMQYNPNVLIRNAKNELAICCAQTLEVIEALYLLGFANNKDEHGRKLIDNLYVSDIYKLIRTIIPLYYSKRESIVALLSDLQRSIPLPDTFNSNLIDSKQSIFHRACNETNFTSISCMLSNPMFVNPSHVSQFLNTHESVEQMLPIHLLFYHGSAQASRIDIVHLFIQHKCNVNAQDGRGNTALHYASQYGMSDIIRILEQNGANSLIYNQAGHTALDMMQQYKQSASRKRKERDYGDAMEERQAKRARLDGLAWPMSSTEQ